MLRSFTYFPGTSLWFVNTCHLYGSSVLVEHFQNWRPQKHDFFFISKVATGWHILLAGVNILFGVRILNNDRIWRRKVLLGGLNLKTNLFYHYTEKLEIL